MEQTSGKVQKKQKKTKSLYFYIIRTFIILLAADLLMAAVLVWVYRKIESNASPEPVGEYVIGNLSFLKNGDYDDLDLKRYLGKGGYYEILDQNAKVIYTSRSSEKNSYSKMVLDYIPDLDKDSGLFAIPFDDRYGTGYILVRIQMETDQSDNKTYYGRLKGLFVVNGKREIQYSNLKRNGKKITEHDLNYMLEASDVNAADDYILQKYAFMKNGERQYLLLHSPVGIRYGQRAASRWILFAVLVFAAGVLASIAMAAISIMKKVRKPLKTLNGAMNTFATGTLEQVDEHSGVAEFDNALGTFNSMEHELQKSEKERRELEEQKRKMLADISHDLKTPITVIRGYIDAMQDGLIPEEEEKKYLEIMAEKTDLMSSLITSFNEYSRLEHPDFQYHFEEGDLAEYLREYMAVKYEELEIAGYFVDVDIPDREVILSFDRGQLKRVFENIISNALKYTKPGTTIFVSLLVQKSEVLIRIGDNGPGMKEELKATAFQPFTIGDESRKSGKGTGLGLSIAKKITEGHHGTIRILSEKEWKKGTMYEISLPFVRPDAL